MKQILQQRLAERYKTLASDLLYLTENLPPSGSRRGICSFLTPGVEFEFYTIAQQWPDHSGEFNNPIGSMEEPWAGDNKLKRIELMLYVLEQLRDNYL